MAEQPGPAPEGGQEAPSSLPEPLVEMRRRPSIIWLLPIVAALIGAWMAVKAYREKGPTVTITFLSAEGLEAGQTRIRYKDVEIGKVSAITLSPDRNHVVVTAEMKKEASSLLSANTRFWVVRARISTNGVSGLGTLLSGAYIGLDPGPPGPWTQDFQGLETPGVVTTHKAGMLVQMRAAKLGSLSVGSSVHFRQVRVGEVVAYDLEKDGTSVLIKAFIDAPYDALVKTGTRFWDAGGVDVVMDANGLRMHSDSMVDLLLGGIAFETPPSLDASGPVPPGYVFNLFPNHETIYEKVMVDRHHYVIDFDESVRGLTRGAPVEYHGIKVGEVEDFRLEFSTETLEGRVPVLVALEPERFSISRRRGQSMDDVVQQLVKRGLRAQLKMGSLLTGSLFVDLDIHPGAPPRPAVRHGGYHGGYPEIPSLPSTMGALLSNLANFAERLQKVPVEELAEELRATIPALRDTLRQSQELMKHMDRSTLPQAEATLAKAQAALASLDRTLNADSPTQQDLRTALEEFTKAARSLRSLTESLDQHPESLIFGKGKKP